MTETTRKCILKRIKKLTGQASMAQKHIDDCYRQIKRVEEKLEILNYKCGRFGTVLCELNNQRVRIERKLTFCVCACPKCMNEEDCCPSCKIKQFANMSSK